DAVFGKMAAVADDHLLDYVIHGTGIDADPADRHAAGFAGAVVIDFQNFAGFHNEALFQARETQMLGQPGVLGKLAEFAVDGHEETRANQVQHQFHFFHTGMAGNVEGRVHVPVQDIGAAPRHVVDHAEDGLLVAGDDARAEHHGVALFHRDMFVVVHGHARERRHRLALGAGDQEGNLIGGPVHGVLRPEQDAVGNLQQPQRMRDLGNRHHTSADYGDAAAVFLGQI